MSIEAWFAGRIPDGWFTAAPDVTVDRDEIVVIGRLAEPEHAPSEGTERSAALEARITGFREETRGRRMRIADEAQRRFERKVSWGVECGDVRTLFTTHSVPVMTRLRMK